ncbi:hypothetical protein KC357_g160 [Hortaea werneckii]|nr:hypothetical protein KC357_g160 [Hortaea werneckii]
MRGGTRRSSLRIYGIIIPSTMRFCGGPPETVASTGRKSSGSRRGGGRGRRCGGYCGSGVRGTIRMISWNGVSRPR